MDLITPVKVLYVFGGYACLLLTSVSVTYELRTFNLIHYTFGQIIKYTINIQVVDAK